MIDPNTLFSEAACFRCNSDASLSDLLKLALLQRIAEAGGGGGGGTPGGAANSVQFNDAGAFGGFGSFNSGTSVLTIPGDLLFNTDNADDIGASGASRPRTGYFGTSVVTPLVASPAATALSFASAGTTRANFSTTGHLLFNTDNTNDIGASGATRPRNIFVGTQVTAGGNVLIGGAYYHSSGQSISFSGVTNIRLNDNTGVSMGLLQFGGTAATHPAIKRSSTTLQVRLADDSAFGTFQGILQTSVNATASGAVVNTHTIPITDASGTVYRVLCLV